MGKQTGRDLFAKARLDYNDPHNEKGIKEYHTGQKKIFEKDKKIVSELQNQVVAGEKADASVLANMVANQRAADHPPVTELEGALQGDLGQENFLNYKEKKEKLDKLQAKTFGSLLGSNFQKGYDMLQEDYNKKVEANKKKIKDKYGWDQETPLEDFATSLIHGITAGAVALVKAPYDKYKSGRFTEQEDRDLIKLRKEVNETAKPTLIKQREELLKNREADFKKYGIDPDKGRIAQVIESKDLDYETRRQRDIIRRNYSDALDEYDNAISGEGLTGGFLNGTVGLLKTGYNIERALVQKGIKEKEARGEAISEKEQDLLKSYVVADKAVNGNLNSNSNYQVGQSLRGSVEFLAEFALSGGAIRKVGDKVAQNSLKKIINAGVTETLVSPIFMPSTYNQALEKYNNPLQEIENPDGSKRYIISDASKKTAVKFFDGRIKILNSEIELLKAKENPDENTKYLIASLEEEKGHVLDSKSQLVDEKGNLIREEIGLGESAAYGYTQNLKENFTERYVGGFLDKLGGKAMKGLAKSENKILRGLNKANDGLQTWRKSADDTLFNSNKLGKVSRNLYMNIGPTKSLHSLPSEMVEEITNQFLPTLGEDYASQLEELGNKDFYTQVALSTLLMGGGTQAFGAASHYGKKAFIPTYRDFINNKQSQEAQYRAIDAAVTDDQLAKDIAMSTLGGIHDVMDYQARVADLRNPKGENKEGLTQDQRDKKADVMEKTSFINMALHAIQTGTVDDFKMSLNKLAQNERFSEETKANAASGLKSLTTFQNIVNQYKDLENSAKLTEDNITLHLLDKSREQLKDSLYSTSNREFFQPLLDAYAEKREKAGEDSVDTSFDSFADSILNHENGKFELGEFLDEHNTKKEVVDIFATLRSLQNIQENRLRINEDINYQLDPANQAEIRQKARETQNQLLSDTVTVDNVGQVKDIINEDGIKDSEINNKIDNKIDQQKQTNPTVKPEVPTADIDDTLDKNLTPDLFDLLPGEQETQDDEVENLHPVSADDMFDGEQDTETPDNEEAILLQNTDLFGAPIEVNKEDGVQQKRINDMAAGFKSIKEETPNLDFSGLVAGLRSKYGSRNIEQAYNIINEAWEKAGQPALTQEEKSSIYAENFGNIDSRLDSVFPGAGVTTPINPVTVTTEDLAKEEVDNAPEKLLGVNPVSGKVEVVGTGYKIASPEVKIATLGVTYTISEDGMSYTTDSTEVNTNAFPALHWSNFQEGQKVPLSFKWSYFDINGDNPMRIWSDIDSDQPTQKKSNIKEVVESIFGAGTYESVLAKTTSDEGRKELLQNEEFLKILPTSFKVNGQETEIGINDNNWWNAVNTALPTDAATGEYLPEARSRIIRAGREYNLATRRAMAQSPNMTLDMTVKENREGFHNRILDQTKFNSLENAFQNNNEAANNNIGMVVIGNGKAPVTHTSNGNPIVKVGDKQVFLPQIQNYDTWIKAMEATEEGKGTASGKIAMVVQSGIKDGQPVYTIHSVINNQLTQHTRFETYNKIADKIIKYKERYQKELEIGEVSPEMAKYNTSLSKFGISLADNSVHSNLRDFYPEKRYHDIKTPEDAERFGKEIGKRHYISTAEVSEVNADGVSELKSNNYRQDYKSKIADNKRSKNVLDILDFETVADFEKALAEDSLKGTTYQNILLRNMHTQFIFNEITAPGKPAIWTSEVQPIISFDNSHLTEEQLKEVKKAGIDTTTDAEKVSLEIKVLDKEIADEKALLAQTENERDKKRIQKRIDIAEKRRAELGGVKSTVKESIKKAVAEVEKEVKPEREFTYSDLIDINNELLYLTLKNVDLTENFDKTKILISLGQTFRNTVERLMNNNQLREAQYMLDNRDLILGINQYDGSVREQIDALFELEEDGDFDFDSDFVKDVNKESFENNAIQSLSAKVKMILAGIVDTRNNVETFGDFGTYMPFSQSVDALQQILSNVNNNTLSEIQKEITLKVFENPAEFGFYEEIGSRLDQLNKTNPDLLNQILYALYQPKTEMVFLAFSEKGGFKGQRYDANSKNIDIIKRGRWKENLRNSPLVNKFEEGKYNINPEVAARVMELYTSMKANVDAVKVDDIKEYLGYFGISLNKATLSKMKYNGFQNADYTLYTVGQDGVERGILANNQLIDHLNKNLVTAMASTKELVFEDKYADNPGNQMVMNLLTNDTNNSLKNLVKADNLVSFVPSQSMYIAGKMINSYEQPKSLSNTVNSMKSDEKYVADTKATSITSESMIMEMIANNPDFASYFDVINVSLEALKELGKESRDDMGITNLSTKDHFVTTFNMFAHNDGAIMNDDYTKNKEINLRKGTVSFPALSDSSRMPLIKTVLLDIQKTHLNPEMNRLTDNVLQELADRMVLPEFKRIAAFLKAGGKTNIKGHDAGAERVTSFISLNSLMVKTEDSSGNTILRPLTEVFKKYSDNGEAHVDNVEAFLRKYQEEIFDDIQANINQEVDTYISEDGTTGLMRDNDIYDGDSVNFIDSKYLKSKTDAGNGLQRARLVSYDYVVNYMMTQREIQTLFAGDVAGYFKDNMKNKFDSALPIADISDIAKVTYPDLTEQDLDAIREALNSAEGVAFIKENYPALLSATETALNDLEDRYRDLQPVLANKVNDMFQDVQNNLAKRLKALISPGNQYPDSKGSLKYFQVMLADAETASETLESMIELHYPGMYADVAKEVKELKRLDAIYEADRTDKQSKKYKNTLSSLQNKFPKIAGYFRNAATDAQEYSTWRDNLYQLKSQGRVNQSEFDAIYDKLEAQENDLNKDGVISDENRWGENDKELQKKAIMQPTKPLYSGLHHEDNNGYMASRYIYIKSSSFPLLPELTEKFPNLENMRKNLSKAEQIDHNRTPVRTVRASYETANKVGAAKNPLSVSELYKADLDMTDFTDKYAVELNRDNFYVQQDKPFKSDKNAEAGKHDENNRATQFEKILLGDDLNKIPDHIFPNMFDAELIEKYNVEVVDGMLNGPGLKKIYDATYKEEQAVLQAKLLADFNIESMDEMYQGKPEAMEKLVDLLKKRLSNKQDKEALELLYTVPGNPIPMSKQDVIDGGHTPTRAAFKIPLYMMPNSKKFESVLNSVINKNSVNLGLPGFSSPVASQEGFKGYKGKNMLKKLTKQGLVTTANFDPAVGLKSVVVDGKLTYAQVFIASKYKVYNKQSGKYEYIKMEEFIDPETGMIDTEKLPEELLSMFSFRIPTSSHQSGTMIEVVGFLPHTSADLMIVPKDHATQIGEDYDIDTRYVYNYHYIKKDGKLKKLGYEDIVRPEKTVNTLRKEFEEAKDLLWNAFYDKNSNVDTKDPLNKGNFKVNLKNDFLVQNKDSLMELAFLEASIADGPMDRLLQSLMGDEIDALPKNQVEAAKKRVEELNESLFSDKEIEGRSKELVAAYRQFKSELIEEFQNQESPLRKAWNEFNIGKDQKANEKKVIENNIVSLYKSVFSSADSRVQSLITKVLSTDNAENTANAMDKKIKAATKKPMYNLYSPHVQRETMKLGADGKIGIGEHSNAVTMNSLFQQSDYEHRLISHYKKDKETGEFIPVHFNIMLGAGQIFDGVMGKVTDGNIRTSELAMESQNSATDNQKLQIMGKRNENSNTMTVLKILQANMIDNDGIIIEGFDKPLSYSSLFINQPILRRYSELMDKMKSSTSKNFGDVNELVEEQLLKEFFVQGKMNEDGKFEGGVEKELGAGLTSKKLWDELVNSETTDKASQWYVYQSFKSLQNAAKKYNEVQQFINIEKGGMGVSYFDTIALMDRLKDIMTNPKKGVSNQDKLIGEYAEVDLEGEIAQERMDMLVADGYIRLVEGGNQFVKPTNHYAHKIVNSIVAGYNMFNNLFPYDHKHIQEQVDGIFAVSNINPKSKAGLELKYSIIANLKDYAYSNNKTLFNGDIDSSIKELFFDNSETKNQSLASYLSALQNNDKYAALFNNPFFKDLQFDINEGGFPSTIKFNNSDISKLNNLDIHNIFMRMMDSKEVLPPYNGKEYTYEKLTEDLLKYSLIGDQGNGAIGFRHLITLKMFDKHKVSNTIRTTTDPQNELIQNIIYNGYFKSIESLTGKSFNENGVSPGTDVVDPIGLANTVKTVNAIIFDKYGIADSLSINAQNDVTNNYFTGEIVNGNYVKQFIQHNPKHVGTMAHPLGELRGNSKLEKLMKANGMTVQDLNQGKVNNFYYEGDMIAVDTDGTERKIGNIKQVRKGEVVIYRKNNFISLKDVNNKILLFEKKTEQGYYEQIPTLGSFGFNEYQVGKNIKKSKVEKNNPDTSWKLSLMNHENLKDMINKEDLQSILESMIAEKNGPFSAVIEMFLPMVDISNTRIEVVPEMAGNAMYWGGQNLIQVSQSYLDSNPSNEKIQETFVEEFLHRMTTQLFEPYVAFTGIDIKTGKLIYETKVDKIPAEMLTLINVYNKAFSIVAKRQGLETLMKTLGTFTNQIDSKENGSLYVPTQDGMDAYRVLNIHEFIAGVFLKNKPFAKEMANTKYMNSDKSILEKFADVFVRLYNRVLPNRRTDTIASEVVTQLYNFMKNETHSQKAGEAPKINKVGAMKKQPGGLSRESVDGMFPDQVSNDPPVGFDTEIDIDPLTGEEIYRQPTTELLSKLTTFVDIKKQC